MNKYTADEAAEKLKSHGFGDFTKRTVNYYAFEKNMFNIQENGKGIFTDREIEKLAAIKLLRTHTNYTLEQIKNIINNSSLEDIKGFCKRRVDDLNSNLPYLKEAVTSSNYSLNIQDEASPSDSSSKKRTVKVNSDVTLIVSENVDTQSLRKIIEFIKSI
jgi:DNA-binding transcriptional MerR regulator